MSYRFPGEGSRHDATWLIWPHEYTYGKKYRAEIEDVWVQMAKALVGGERVVIVAYDLRERDRIAEILGKERVDLNRMDFVIAKSDDVWARDTGPIFAFDEQDRLTVVDFNFDGWGEKDALS